MANKLLDGNLPPSYMRLWVDGELTPGPPAPRNNEEDENHEVYTEPIPAPSAPPPPYEEGNGSFAGPDSPDAKVNTYPRTLKYTTPYLVFEEIYDACINYVNSYFWYSSTFVSQMKLSKIHNECAFHYSLESFCEKRESARKFTPYEGGPIDGPSNGNPPLAWDMQVPLPTIFQDAKTQRIIPHTDSVDTCSSCCGNGLVTCSTCEGRGRKCCWACSGSRNCRNSQNERCSSCNGTGYDKCFSCSGNGKVTCYRCDGYGKMKSYKILIVTWITHLGEFVSNTRNLPGKNIKNVTGDTLIIEERNELSPIYNAPDESVKSASARLLEDHQKSFPNEMIRKQRHTLRAVPFTIAKYKWKAEKGEFYIYGKEREVYFENYPTSCCCVCC